MTISSYEYSYYFDGSDACKVRNEGGIIETTEYEYDGLKRLTEESVKVGNNTTDTYAYEYDDYGNRSKMTATGTEDYVTEYSYVDSNGKYTALLQKEVKTVEGEENPLDRNSNVKQTVYTYDANGNQVKKVADGKTETNKYDGLNQLIGFTDGDTTASYKYNVSGLRYEKTVDGQTINHVWDGSKQIIADVIDNQFYEAECYIRGTNLVAKYNFKNCDKSEYTYYTQNAHGDVVNLTDKDGKVIKKYTYDAFGVEKNIDENDANAFRYCGEYYDKETATVYLRARYYNPSTGRFISRDSYAGKNEDPLSLNRYTYCHNNPIFYFDSNGHNAFTKWCKNRGKDIKALGNDIKKGAKDTASSVNQKIIRPVSKKIDQGCKWIDNNIITPVYDGVNKFGKAVYHSTSFELGAGCGIGGEVKCGFADVSLLVAPMREEYIIASDCKTNVTGNYSIGATFFDTLGLVAEAKRTAYNNGIKRNPYTAPGGHWETNVSFISPNASLSDENEFNLEVGGALYLYLGIDYTLSFNVSNFAKEMGIT